MKTKKLLLFTGGILLLFIITNPSASAQSTSLLKNFDSIPMGKLHYEVLGMMANAECFGEKQEETSFDKSGDYNFNEYLNDSVRVILCFYKGILYQKKLTYKYSIYEMYKAKEASLDAKEHVLKSYKIYSLSKGDISNTILGEKIGEIDAYRLAPKIKPLNEIEIDFSATISNNLNESSNKISPKIIGYQVNYITTDLSNTPLSLKNGFTSFQ